MWQKKLKLNFLNNYKNMKKSDLKTGMIIKTRDGRRGIVLLNTPEGDVIGSDGRISRNRTFQPLYAFNEDLQRNDDDSVELGNSDFDIVKVWGYSTNREAVSFEVDRELLWDESAITLTKEEAEEKLSILMDNTVKIK